MIFLPIVERELRASARRRATYGMRVKIGAGAVLALGICYVLSLTDASFHFGQVLFLGLSGLCMLYCLAAGRIMTADCLSWEKREGTLGLLFLTDLKGYDVVVGKMAASSLDGFYGMLTIFPILAIPLLAGGLTRGEFWRMLLVLVDTFVFSLSIGLCASAMNRDEQRAKGANLALLLWLAGVPAVLGGMLLASNPGFTLSQQLFYTCPIYAFVQSLDVRYRVAPADFWWCIAINFLLAFLLLLFACRVTPHSWQDKAAGRRGKGGRRRRWWRDGNESWDNAFRKRLLDRNAYLWLASRPNLRAAYVWLFVGLLTGLLAANLPRAKNLRPELVTGFIMLLTVTLKLWMTAESSRQLAYDKRAGAFELLLSTPLTVGDVLRGEGLALRRQFLKPVLLVAAGESVISLLAPWMDWGNRCFFLAYVLVFVFDAMALGPVGMLAALTSKSHGRATIKTAARIFVLPWLIFFGIELVMRLFGFFFIRQFWGPGYYTELACWLAVGIAVDVFFIFRSRRLLRACFRQFAFEPPPAKRWFAWLVDLRTGDPQRKAALRAGWRRALITTAALACAATVAVFYDVFLARVNSPAPVVVAMKSGGRHVEVLGVPSGFLIVLPDGTVWSWGREKSISPPRRILTNQDWAQLSVGNQTVGIRTNGTLWTWSLDNTPPSQVGSDRDWVEARSGGNLILARKQNDTLWAWGRNSKNQLGNGPGPARTEPTQVGTNHDWKAIGRVNDDSALALREDGTLWTWGEVSWTTNTSWRSTNFPKPIQLCRETNWVTLQSGHPDYARNQFGELWRILPLRGRPGSNIPIASLSTMYSNMTSATFSAFFTTNWDFGRYEVRADGTLWVAPWSWMDWPGKPAGPPHQVGTRTDWLCVWSFNQTLIGQTADGTLWTWGLDFGKDSRWVQVLADRMEFVRHKIEEMSGDGSDNYGDWISGEYATQVEPRPLFRLIRSNAPPTSPH